MNLNQTLVKKIKLSDYFGKKKVVLVFYVKDNTPGCTAEMKGIKNYHPKISDKYEVFGINQDSKESHANFCQKHDLPFKILADKGKESGHVYTMQPASLGMYTKRITYLIGLDGRIEKIIDSMGASSHIEFVQSLADS